MIGGPGLAVPEVRHIGHKEVLDDFGLVGGRRILLEGVLLLAGHFLHLGYNHCLEHVQEDLLVHFFTGLEEVGGHHVAVAADHP